MTIDSDDEPARVKAPNSDSALESKSATVSLLEGAAWKLLNEAQDRETFAGAWLALQCDWIGGVVRAVVAATGEDGRAMEPIASWPEGKSITPGIADAISLAAEEQRGVVRSGGSGTYIAYPVRIEERLSGVIGLELANTDSATLRQVMRHLQWGVAWLRDKERRRLAEAERTVLDRTKAALELIVDALDEERFSAACRAVVTDLATRLDCTRVSVGFLKRGQAAVRSISHSAQFGKQMNLVRMIEAAMDEAIDQRSTILYPSPDEEEPCISRCHEELVRVYGAGTCLTFPLFVTDAYVGAITLERSADNPFEQDAIDLLDCVSAVIGPILEEKRCNDRWIGFKVFESFTRQCERFLGPGYLARKLTAAAAIAAVGFFYFATTEYRIAAPATIEGTVQRAIVALFDGFIKTAPVRVGDQVRKGQLLAALDDRDLTLERLRWVTERQQRRHEFERALGARNRADTNIIKTQIEQAEAQIRLIDEKLSRAKLLAPFDGLVVSGDLSQSIGAAKQRGAVLFEIAPLNSYRVILQVDESQISDVSPGQRGQLLTTSLLDEPLDFVVDKVTPVAEASGGRNSFRVEARVESNSVRLRPGMEGVGKIDVETRRLIWVWSRAARDWWRLSSWRWLP
ncbi:MAG: HlyD family efflux transporter periplasmic adaptor subunit [Rhodospirillales bacterium]|nr:HlyD family efflux transporter periplasmic adaptor subunit [Rhodospirillales bacterium]